MSNCYQENRLDEKYYEEEILRPLTYLYQVRSHDIVTTKVLEAFDYWLKIPKDKYLAIENIMRLFVNCTLLFDDVQDHSILRRTIPAAHCVFGVPLAINASIHVIGVIIQKLQELGHPKAVDIFIRHKLELLRGQGIDIYWREHMRCPTEAEYKQICEKKSSAMFMLAVQLMQLFSNDQTDYTEFLRLYGIYYEIRDDYCNLVKQESMEGRSRSKELQLLNEVTFCEDMTDGKFSFPVIHALKNKKGKEIYYMLKQHSRDLTMKRHFVSLLNELGSLQYTRSVLHSYEEEIRAELTRLGGNPILEEMVNDMSDWADE